MQKDRITVTKMLKELATLKGTPPLKRWQPSPFARRKPSATTR